MAPSRHFRFTSSDGLALTGRVTLPSGVAKPPLVVLTGPKLSGPRATANFDEIAQFFASRGYAVVRIDHRGTAGFGRDFAAAGDFQIATGIARDLTEGVQWLAGQGLIDESRVAIFGEKWGGLIAFHLAANTKLFRALVNFDTPLDVGGYVLPFFATSGRGNEELTAAIGGEKAAAAYAKTVEPFSEIPRLVIPSFHYYSPTETDRVSDDGLKLRSILKKKGSTFEILFGKNADLMRTEKAVYWKEQAAHYEATANFLDKHLLGAVDAK